MVGRCLRQLLTIAKILFCPQGIYTVRFNIEGAWKPVVVDDYLPCKKKNGGGEPAFATSNKPGELWVSILEKAYAKLHGCYEALEGGVVQVRTLGGKQGGAE